ncbi:MAG: helix-turn-helix domain-containing protein [Victivallales bacterium]|nr:helix-turn-helix domain-containing protein [Victivallales bacterium]
MVFKNKLFRKKRKEQRYTAAAMAESLKVSRKTIYNWENGESLPPRKMIIRISRLLKISPDVLSDLNYKEPDSEPKLTNSTKNWISIFNTEENSTDNAEKVTEIIKSLFSRLNDATVILSAIFSSIQYPLYIKDNNNNFIMVNKSFLKTLSKSEDFNYRNRNDYAFFPKTEAEKNYREDQNTLLTGNSLFEKESYMPGTRKKRRALISKIPILDRKKKIVGLVGTFVDITQPKKDESKRILLQELIDGIESYIMIVQKQKKKNNTDYTVEYVNDYSLKRILGGEKPAGLNLTKLWKEQAPKHYKMFIDKIENNHRFPVQHKYWTNHPNSEKTGFFLEKIFNPFPDYYYIISYDITEIHSLYTENYSYFQNFTGNTFDWKGVLNNDGADIKLNNTGDNIERLTGFKTSEVTAGKLSLKKLFPKKYHSLFQEWLKNIDTVPFLQHWIQKKDGKPAWCETRIAVKSEKNVFTCFGATAVLNANEHETLNLMSSQEFTMQHYQNKSTAKQ